MTGPRILPPGRAHVEVMAELHKMAFPLEAAWSATAFAELLHHPGSFALLAEGSVRTGEPREESVEPLGFVLCRTAGGECEVLTVAVLPRARRQGIGRALIHAALDHAAARGAETVFLEVAADNPAAQALYRGQGFALAGRRQAYYRSTQGDEAKDALVMRRSIRVETIKKSRFS